jgi:hypothetical protein
VSSARTPRERAARLLRWYPRTWRERYGEEFAELLVADIEERPRSTAAVTAVRRAELPPRVLAYETRFAAVACGVMGVFLVCGGAWVYAGRSPGLTRAGQAGAYAGLIDLAATVLLALAAACLAQRTALRTLRLARP